MAKHHVPGRSLAPISHATARAWLLDYYYHRLGEAREAALEAHARTCAACSAEDLKHLVTERMQAMRQPSRIRHPLTTPLAISLCTLLALSVVFAALLVFVAQHDGRLGALFGRGQSSNSGAVATPTLSPTATPLPTPIALKAISTIGTVNTVTLAASPDGTAVAAAANGKGVEIYKNGKAEQHLSGFDGFNAPGSLVWSPDGTALAASGALTLYVWKLSSGEAFTVPLKANPGTDLYVFDWAGHKVVGSYTATALFGASGLAQWGEKGQVAPAPLGSASGANIPDSHSPIFALWGGQQGVRLFRDPAANALDIGMNDADIAAHAALLRWSPDGRFLLWGYPRLAIALTATVNGSLTSTPTTNVTAGVAAPNQGFAVFVTRLSMAPDPAAVITLWPSPDGQRMIVMDGSVAPAQLSIIDSQTTAPLNILPAGLANGHPLLGACTWEAIATIRIACATGAAPAGEYAPAD